MLVLSRKAGEAIVFPSLGITVAVSRLRGKNVTLAVEAPEQVRILRKELVPQLQKSCVKQLGPKISHELRNKLNSVGLSLNVLLRQTEVGKVLDTQVLKQAIDELHELDDSLKSSNNCMQAGADVSDNVEEQRLALLVEDNHNEASLLSAYLREYGFRVINAQDGQAALNFLEYSPHTPDVVLLDMNMPGMNGQETIRVIRQRPQFSGLRLFAVSGMAPEEARVAVGEPTGVNRWFQKPIRPDELVSQLKKELAA